jgi:hypothetical protein
VSEYESGDRCGSGLEPEIGKCKSCYSDSERNLTMPTVSKKQFRFMEGVSHGTIKAPGLKPEVAREFVEATPHPGKLPETKEEKHMRRFEKLFAPKRTLSNTKI